MAYTVLARRYRSRTFDDLVGQRHVAQTLKKAIATNRIAHAYLFCGTRGTGKTSTARILAKSLNCQSVDAPTPAPCGTCNSCTAIARGDDMDVLEIDAASNTGVDNVRDVIENSQYTPAHSRFKIYIIDEVHMLSKSAFNALLKTLEEPPSHVKFILATTEPEKVLPTILSRCQRYDFRSIPTREIAEHLRTICQNEKIDADADALLLVAKAGAGSMRDALSLLDRLLSVGEMKLTAEMIEQLLGLPKNQLLLDLCAAIGTGDVAAVLTQADRIITGGLAPDSLIASLIDHLRNLLILRTCGPDSGLVEVPGLSIKELIQQANLFDAVNLSQDIALLEELRRTLRGTQAGRALLEATLVRLTLAEQFTPIADLLDGRAPTEKKKPEPTLTPTPSPAGEGRGEGDFAALETSASHGGPHPGPLPKEREPEHAAAEDDDDDDALPQPGRVWTGPSLAEELGKSKLGGGNGNHAEPSNVESPALAPDAPAAAWASVLALLAQHAPPTHAIVHRGTFWGIDNGRAVVRFSAEQRPLVGILDRNGKRESIVKAYSRLLGQEVGLIFEFDEADVAPARPAAKIDPLEAALRGTMPPPAATPPPPAKTAPSSPGRSAAAPPPPEPMQEISNGVRLTSELRDALYRNNPLIKAVIDELGGEIVRVE